MSDKPTDKFSDDDNDPAFSLNKFDLGDDQQQADDFTDKQAPIVPDLFEASTDPLPNVVAETSDERNDPLPSAPRAESTTMYAEPDVMPEDDILSAPDEPVHNDSKSNTMVLFFSLAVVGAVLLAWFYGSSHDDVDLMDNQSSQANNRPQDMQAKVSLLQQRLSSLQSELRSKNKQIAELTHLLSERALQQQPVPVKLSSRNKKAPVVNKLKQPVKTKITPVQQNAAGTWAVIIASVNSRFAAEKALARLKAKGIAADIHPTTVKGKAWFRLRVSGLASRAEAEIQKTYLADQHGIKGTWIHNAK